MRRKTARLTASAPPIRCSRLSWGDASGMSCGVMATKALVIAGTIDSETPIPRTTSVTAMIQIGVVAVSSISGTV